MTTWDKVSKPHARKLYDAGFTVYVVGDNVNTFHFINGWCLASPINKDDHYVSGYDETVSFDTRIEGFEFYLERSLGRRCAYYLRSN